MTFFAPADPDLADLKIDHWISCGAQVSFFAELGLFMGQPVIQKPQKLKMPDSVTNWTNYYDTNDMWASSNRPGATVLVRVRSGNGPAFAHTVSWRDPVSSKRWPSAFALHSMTLVADAAPRALAFTDVPGHRVHALIIGISDYTHLIGGSGPLALATAGMRQLEVCAKTAASIFDWLKSRDRVAGAPVVSCRLLLAPRPGEQAEVETLAQAITVTSRRSPRRGTADTMAAGGTTREPNVAFFFFSGHGWSTYRRLARWRGTS